MLQHRIKGCLWAFSAVLIAVNGGLFAAYLLAERKFSLMGLIADDRVWMYILAAPVSVIYSDANLRKALQQVRAPSLWHSMLTATRMAVLQAITIFALYFIFKDMALSRAFILGFLIFAFLLNIFLVYSLPTLVTRAMFGKEGKLNAILYGFGELPPDMREYVSRAQSQGIRFIGYYADEKLQLPGMEWLGSTKEVMTCEGGRKRIRAELAFAYCDSDSEHLDTFRDGLDTCSRRGARVHVYSNLSRTFPDPVRVTTDGRILFFSFMDEPLQNPLNQMLKRTVDVVVSLPVVLFILPPLTVLVWLVQRFQSPGPLLFKQTRYGINRRPFTIYKYRTMHVHDRKLEGKQASKGDKRIFPFGAFLRKTSLDEFPQFFNSLRGNMSVVGPRPHLTLHDDEFEKYFRRYRSRHYVKPGITGLAQVSGYRGETRNEQEVIGRVERDLEYITGWTLGQEIYLILKTAWQVLFPPKSAV